MRNLRELVTITLSGAMLLSACAPAEAAKPRRTESPDLNRPLTLPLKNSDQDRANEYLPNDLDSHPERLATPAPTRTPGSYAAEPPIDPNACSRPDYTKLEDGHTYTIVNEVTTKGAVRVAHGTTITVHDGKGGFETLHEVPADGLIHPEVWFGVKFLAFSCGDAVYADPQGHGWLQP